MACPIRTVAELLVATSQNGAILANGQNGGRFGTDANDFVNTDTAEADRAVAWVNAPTGTSLGDIENNDRATGCTSSIPTASWCPWPTR